MIIIRFIIYTLIKHILGLEKDKAASELELCFCDSSLGCDRGRARIVELQTSTSISASAFFTYPELREPKLSKIAIEDEKIDLSKCNFIFP
jgi:hypothetical protein